MRRKNEKKRPEQWLPISRVAEKLDEPVWKVKQWRRYGKFPNAQLVEYARGPVWLIPLSDVEKFTSPTVGRPRGGKKELSGNATCAECGVRLYNCALFCSWSCHNTFRHKNPLAKTLFPEVTGRVIKLHRARHNSAAMRAKRYGVLGVFTWHEWVLMLEASGGVCAHCKSYVGIENLGIDHVLPMSLGGNHSAENIAASCFPCNAGKDRKSAETTPNWRIVMAPSVTAARERRINLRAA